MKTYISLLRGINVSGHKIIKMDALRTMFTAMQFADVRTYIQSGNVVFRSADSDQKLLARKIKEKILDEFGFDVPVMVVAQDELRIVLENNAFVNDRNEDVKSLHVAFLSEVPDSSLIDAISGFRHGNDRFIVTGKTVYLFLPDGSGKSKLTNTFFEKNLNVAATVRNWRTANQLALIAEDLP